MAKFLIEVPHPEEEVACARVVKTFLTTGSHYLAQADWGCMDGVHKSWMMVEAENKDEARRILPSMYRSQASIVQLNKFTVEQMDDILRHHK